MKTLGQLRNATLNARHLTQDKSIGTRVELGRIQVVRVTYLKGKSAVDELSAWGTIDDAIRFLNNMVAL